MQAKVSDWDAFQATAKEVYDASGNKTALTTTLGGIWQAFAANRSTPWVVDDKLAVDDFCNTFIDLAKNMRDNGYVTELNQWTDEWKAAGQTDDTMGYFVSTWGFGESILLSAAGGEGGTTYGKWNVCQGPTPYYWGGTWICAAQDTDNASLVKDIMLKMTTDDDVMKDIVLDDDDFVNNKPAMEAMAADTSYQSKVLGGQNPLAMFCAGAEKIDLSNLSAYDQGCNEEFQNAMTGYFDGNYATYDEALEAFYTAVTEKYPELTYLSLIHI